MARPSFQAVLRRYVKRLVDDMGGNRKQFGEKHGIKPGEVTNVVNKAEGHDVPSDKGNVSPLMLERIARARGERLSHVLADLVAIATVMENEALRPHEAEQIEPPKKQPSVSKAATARPLAPVIPLRAAAPPASRYSDEPEPTVRLPLFRIAAGKAITAIDDADEYVLTPQTLLNEHHLKLADAFALRVQGESMSGDNIHDGDFVLLRRLASPVSYRKDAICAILDRRDDTVTLKRIRRSRSGVATLTPSNPDMKPYTLPVDDAVPQGEFVAVIRRAGEKG